jgi:hypothetical protein
LEPLIRTCYVNDITGKYRIVQPPLTNTQVDAENFQREAAIVQSDSSLQSQMKSSTSALKVGMVAMIVSLLITFLF